MEHLFPIILASTSKRRIEILSYFSIPFLALAPLFDESTLLYNNDPEAYVRTLSRKKAESVKADSLILAADTGVFFEGKIFGKPKTKEEAFENLSLFSGKVHEVYTGLTLKYQDLILSTVEKTLVYFNLLSQEDILKYLGKIEWKDKAGGYAIQEKGSILIQRIEGSYYNVMGLPINSLRNLLKNLGIDLWDYL